MLSAVFSSCCFASRWKKRGAWGSVLANPPEVLYLAAPVEPRDEERALERWFGLLYEGPSRTKTAAPSASARQVTSSPVDRSMAKGDGRLVLPDESELLRLYYGGARLPSPSGGFLMVLGVRPEEDGSGSVVLECTSSSLRYEMIVPKATRAERQRVRVMIKEGGDPKCPRHIDQLLTRIRHDLACPRCGVRYAKAK